MYEMLPTLIRGSVPRVFLGSDYTSTFCPVRGKDPGSQKETGAQHKPQYFCRKVRHGETALSVRVVGALPKPKFPDVSQKPTLQAGHSKAAVPGLLD